MSSISQLLKAKEADILTSWDKEQKTTIRSDLQKGSELMEQSRQFYQILSQAISKESLKNSEGPEWNLVKEFLRTISYSRGVLGFSPTETAQFVFTLKKSITGIARRNKEISEDELIELSDVLDKFGLFTTEIHQKAREEVINRQQQDMLELSTPVVELAAGIIALPMIGTLDSHRTQIVMETLLQRIVETEADIAIIDITGVPTVDTLVAQHLLKTVTAARLMGAECIISGIRPQIAATIVHLGVELGNVITKATLASAFNVALAKTGHMLVKKTQVNKA